MRKPENKEKFKAAIETIITFYGKRDRKMVADVLSQEAETARALETEYWERRMKRKDDRTERREVKDGGLEGSEE